MADIGIDTNTSPSMDIKSFCGSVFIDQDTGYVFYSNSSSDLVYKKTTDGGATWSSATSIRTGTLTGIAIWYDGWTPGDSGQIIHIAYVDWVSADDTWEVLYRDLDTSDDSLGTEILLEAFGLNISGVWTLLRSSSRSGYCGITKAVNGYLYLWVCATDSGAGNLYRFYKSTDSGATWSAVTSPFDAFSLGYLETLMVAPADTGSDADLAGLFIINGTSIKGVTYRESIDAWIFSVSGASGSVGSNSYFQAGISQKFSDLKIIVAYTILGDDSLYCAEITGDTVPVWTQLTNVITDGGTTIVDTRVFIDQNSNDIYVMYLKTSDPRSVFYKASDDNGSTWGSETQINEDTADDFRALWSGYSTPGTNEGRFYPIWFNDDLNDLMGGFTNSIAFEAGFSGVIAATLVAATSTLSGAQNPEGDIDAVLQLITSSLSGSIGFTGSLQAQLQAATSSMLGFMITSGMITSEMQLLLASMSGALGDVSGTLSGELQEPTASASGYMWATGELVASLQAVIASIESYMKPIGTIAGEITEPTFAGTATAGITGTIAAALVILSMAANGYMLPDGTLGGELQRALMSGTGLQSMSAVLTAVLQETLFSSTDAHQSQVATIEASLQALEFIMTEAGFTEFRRGNPRYIRPGITKIKGSR